MTSSNLVDPSEPSLTACLNSSCQRLTSSISLPDPRSRMIVKTISSSFSTGSVQENRQYSRKSANLERLTSYLFRLLTLDIGSSNMLFENFTDRRSRQFLLVSFNQFLLMFDRRTDNDAPDPTRPNQPQVSNMHEVAKERRDSLLYLWKRDCCPAGCPRTS